MSAAERASEANGAEQANDWAVRVNEQMGGQMGQRRFHSHSTWYAVAHYGLKLYENDTFISKTNLFSMSSGVDEWSRIEWAQRSKWVNRACEWASGRANGLVKSAVGQCWWWWQQRRQCSGEKESQMVFHVRRGWPRPLRGPDQNLRDLRRWRMDGQIAFIILFYRTSSPAVPFGAAALLK